MSAAQNLKAQLADGTIVEFAVDVSQGEPWRIEFAGFEGARRRFEAADLFEALRAMREDLERDGYRLLCAGARPDVAASPMSRQMGGGRKAYVMRLGQPAATADLIDIFDDAAPAAVGTVAEQRAYFAAWTRSLRAQRQ